MRRADIALPYKYANFQTPSPRLFMMRGTVALVVVLSFAACASENTQQDVRSGRSEAPLVRPVAASPRLATPQLGNYEIVVPSAKLPKGLKVDRANNNLDVVVHDGRHYLAFRTAPTHFASAKTKLYVVSRLPNQENWRFETEFALGADLREPRFLSYKGRLVLYFAKLGGSEFGFEPEKMLRSELRQGRFTRPKPVFEPGFIPWRIKIHEGRALMVGYKGGEATYSPFYKAIDVLLLVSDDGLNWRPLDPKHPVVYSGGGSEADIAFDKRGNLYAVVRNESGDLHGFGSQICFAEKGALARWRCKADGRKFDSPLLLNSAGEIYLIARRNVARMGEFDLKRPWPAFVLRKIANLADYSLQPKRCAIWHLDRGQLQVRHLIDLPSAGDTCFPSAIRKSERVFEVYNYTSPLGQRRDPVWIEGQLGKTIIYRSVVTFPARNLSKTETSDGGQG